MTRPIFIVISIIVFAACQQRKAESLPEISQPNSAISYDSLPNNVVFTPDYDTLLWKEITTEDHGILLDIKYATTDNFTKNQIYDCPRCLLRPLLADKIIMAHQDIQKKYGLRIKLFDCYRPRPAQQKLWDIVPDARYVTRPSKGSMHNRGLAVDLTLVDYQGVELDMGTGFDEFSKLSHTDHSLLNDTIKKNRLLLHDLMIDYGLSGIRTEWWHYSLKSSNAELSSYEWKCTKK